MKDREVRVSLFGDLDRRKWRLYLETDNGVDYLIDVGRGERRLKRLIYRQIYPGKYYAMVPSPWGKDFRVLEADVGDLWAEVQGKKDIMDKPLTED